ncbi:MAG: glycosyltransferase family 4 protein [Anaerolineae bacterium]
MPTSQSKSRPKILQIETGYNTQPTKRDSFDIEVIDYKIYENVPYLWRKIETLLRLDIYLALKAKAKAKDYDIIWAGSEKVGIPLSFLRLKQPLVVIAHHLESRLKSAFLNLFQIPGRWAGVGYSSFASKAFFINELGVPETLTFQCYAANYLKQVNDLPPPSPTGKILCAGVAKRDYKTLLSALTKLDGFQTQIFVSSRFGDTLKNSLPTEVPNWVDFPGYVTDEELLQCYKECRFVVIPLEHTQQGGAGSTAFLEAASCGKAVIATETVGMKTLIEQGVNGLLVPPNDPQAMQDAIQSLWEQPKLAEKMGKASRKLIESQYNPATVSTNINKFLERFLHK